MTRPLAALALIVLLAACASPATSPIGTVPPRTLTSQTPVKIEDCILSASAYAWQDLDRDGLPDLDEPPLPGVPVWLLWWSGMKGKTDDQGEADLIAAGDCPPPEAVVLAESPPGYIPTTPLRATTTFGPVRFGFAKDSP